MRIGWYDEISVEKAEALSFMCDDPILAAEGDNLCLQAGRILQSGAANRPGAAIELQKNIPMGAGLGGGSSDAATTLLLLNELWDLGCSMSQLRDLGATIGSDVPVFLHPTPALGKGRGEVLSALEDDRNEGLLKIPFSFAVLKPDVHISTAEAYGAIVPESRGRPDLVEVISSLDLDRWKAELVNDFEAPVAIRETAIADALSLLRNSGAGYAAMSGSGSAVFGVFEQASDASEAARHGEQDGYTTWSGGIHQPMRPF